MDLKDNFFLLSSKTLKSRFKYRGFHENGTFSVHSFNDDYLSIPERPGSYKYLFHEIPVIIKAGKVVRLLQDLGVSDIAISCKFFCMYK